MAEEKTYAFNIDAGDLSRELIQFSEFTGQQLFFDSALTQDRQGRAVQGSHTPMEGLLILLQGTGLNAHVNGGDITLSQGVHASVQDAVPLAERDIASSAKAINLGVLSIEATSLNIEDHDYLAYAGYIATQVKTAVVMNTHLHDARFDISAKVWLDPGGRIVRLQLPASSGNDDLDKEIALTLDHLAVNPPPPANMPQPVRIRIESAEP